MNHPRLSPQCRWLCRPGVLLQQQQASIHTAPQPPVQAKATTQPRPTKRDRPSVAERVAASANSRHKLPAAKGLPAPSLGEYYVLTATGDRLAFATTRSLLDHVRRNRDTVAVCLDGCAWRTFASFWRQIRIGCGPKEAFERAELAGFGA